MSRPKGAAFSKGVSLSAALLFNTPCTNAGLISQSTTTVSISQKSFSFSSPTTLLYTLFSGPFSLLQIKSSLKCPTFITVSAFFLNPTCQLANHLTFTLIVIPFLERSYRTPAVWADSAEGHVPYNNPVIGGNDVNGEPIYVGRAHESGDTIPGKVRFYLHLHVKRVRIN